MILTESNAYLPSLCLTVVVITTTVSMAASLVSARTCPGFILWTLGFMCAGISSAAGTIRDIYAFSYIPGFEQVALILALSLGYEGFRRAAGHSPSTNRPVILTVVFGGICLFLTEMLSTLCLGIVMLSALGGVLTASSIWEIKKYIAAHTNRAHGFETGVLGLIFVCCGYMVIYYLVRVKSSIDGLMDGLADGSVQTAIVTIFLTVTAVLVSTVMIRISHQYTSSEQKTKIEDLENAKQKAQNEAKAKSEFLASMSHEIRTPMNGIIGMIDILAGTSLDAEQKDFTRSAMESADSLLRLINDILDFSKMEAGMMETEFIDFDLNITLDAFSDMMGVKAYEKDIEFGCLVDPDVPGHLNGDPGRLRQILTNLAGNSIKFTDKGEVFVRVRRKGENKEENSIELLFSVRDTGIGIAKDKIDLLFESYTQADASVTRKYGGTGLGLAISKQLVELMGGKIWAESLEGKGTTFFFTSVFKIPDTPTQEVDLGLDIQDTRILVVDDNPMNQKVFNSFLTSMGCTVHGAKNGFTVLELLSSPKERFDLAIIDSRTSDIPGEALGKKIRETHCSKNLPLVMISSAGRRGDADKLKLIGFQGFLTKPVKKAQVLGCIRTVLHPDHGDTLVTRYTLKEMRCSSDTPAQGPSLHVLLTEDNKINQKVVTKMLESLGHKVTVAENGKEAVQAIQERSDVFDLILMDAQMPVMGGEEACKRIRLMEQDSPLHTPIIALTANAMKGDREKFLSAGMDGYLSKPVKKHQLAEVFTETL